MPKCTEPRERWLAKARRDPRLMVDEPLEIVEMTDLPYEVRLQLLYRWLALIGAEGEAGEEKPEWKEVMGAILALEGRARLEMDEPEDAPPDHGYGTVPHRDHREE